MPQHYHFTHPDLDFYVDVTVHVRDGRYMATADLGEDSRDGVRATPQEAVKGRYGAWASRTRPRWPQAWRMRGRTPRRQSELALLPFGANHSL